MNKTARHADLAGLILAAGASTRLGQPKQLLNTLPDSTGNVRSLVGDAVVKVSAVCGAGVFVVTGAQHERIEAALSDYSVTTVFNPHWDAGISTSLRAGVDAVKDKLINGILIMLSDQPLIEVDDLALLAETWSIRRDQPAATRYNSGNGVPAILPACMFDMLAALEGDRGASSLFKDLPAGQLINVAGAGLDIDTKQDLIRYREIANANIRKNEHS